jgi:hypothetical protein
MSISIGIYEFFSYTLPGGFYLLVGLYAGLIFGLFPAEPQWLEKAWLFVLVVFVGTAYLAGLLLYPLARLWGELFIVRDLTRKALGWAEKMSPGVHLRICDKEWPLVMAFLKQANPNRAEEIERKNAINLMLRNTSFGLLLLALVQVLYFALESPLIWNLVFALAFLGLSVLAGQQSTKFARMYFSEAYLAVLVLGMKVEDIVSPNCQGEDLPPPG